MGVWDTYVPNLLKRTQICSELIKLSRTASIQIAYLLQIANNFNEYLASFTPHFPSIFSFLDTLDRSFYSLITGQPSSPVGSPISEPMSKHRLSTTEKVRLKSIIERTRLHVVKIMEEGPSNMEDMDIPTESDPHIHNPLSPSSERDTVQDATRDGLLEGENRGRDSGDNGEEDEEDEDEDVDIEMLVAKIYERCLFEVGESLKRTE